MWPKEMWPSGTYTLPDGRAVSVGYMLESAREIRRIREEAGF